MHTFQEKLISYEQQQGSITFNITKWLVEEAFIQRVALLKLPLMLKGSYITRQYLPESLRSYRIPADLDWFGLAPLERARVDQWMITATTYSLDDGLYFRDFRENCFWRMIEYAMADDFPTIDTDLLVYLSAEQDENNSYEIAVDISFDLPLATPAIPLVYQPLIGSPFTLPYSCPLAIQIAWKLHQCIVRPRFKDLVDVIWLLDHNTDINWAIVKQSIEEECLRDDPKLADISKLNLLLDGQLHRHPYFNQNNAANLERRWQAWRTNDKQLYQDKPFSYFGIDGYTMMTDSFQTNSPIPLDLTTLLEQLDRALANSGFTTYFATI